MDMESSIQIILSSAQNDVKMTCVIQAQFDVIWLLNQRHNNNSRIYEYEMATVRLLLFIHISMMWGAFYSQSDTINISESKLFLLRPDWEISDRKLCDILTKHEY